MTAKDVVIGRLLRWLRLNPSFAATRLRGLISSEPLYGPLCPGHLAQAAANLTASCKHAAIVTGFFIPAADPPAAETDGPPGAVVLAIALEAIGAKATLVTDGNCAGAVRAAVAATGGDPSTVAVCPAVPGVLVNGRSAADIWIDDFCAERTRPHGDARSCHRTRRSESR